jgi:hypothetical protein
VSRSRLPLPPVPAGPRPSGTPAPRTSAAPFRAVPSPEPRIEVPVRTPGDLAVPARPRAARSWQDDDAAPVSTGPRVAGGLRTSGPVPRVPRQSTAGGNQSPAYGDWTKPSRADEAARSAAGAGPALEARPGLRGRNAPLTTAIPERSAAARRDRPADGYDDDLADGRVAGASRGTGTGTGPVVGGRAALRAERQAAEVARKKAAKRGGGAPVAVLDDDQDGGRRKPHRVVKGLVAMTVVALGVLGVYSFFSPETQETGAQTPATSRAPTLASPDNGVLPALPSEPVVEPTVAAPVRVPVTVLNSTDINGLAAKISAAVVAGGWESPGVGAYTAGDVAASTVFFTEGDENQRQAAVQLVDQFPQLQGPAPRFFELPPEVAAPGLVVVVTGDWQP